MAIFYRKTLDGDAPVKDVVDVATAPGVKASVASNAEANGIVSHKIADDTVKPSAASRTTSAMSSP